MPSTAPPSTAAASRSTEYGVRGGGRIGCPLQPSEGQSTRPERRPLPTAPRSTLEYMLLQRSTHCIQAPTFRVGGEVVTISPRNAERLIEAIRSAASAKSALLERETFESAAERIERETQLGERSIVELLIGEDEAVLVGLATLQASGDFLRSLERLERLWPARSACDTYARAA